MADPLLTILDAMVIRALHFDGGEDDFVDDETQDDVVAIARLAQDRGKVEELTKLFPEAGRMALQPQNKSDQWTAEDVLQAFLEAMLEIAEKAEEWDDGEVDPDTQHEMDALLDLLDPAAFAEMLEEMGIRPQGKSGTRLSLMRFAVTVSEEPTTPAPAPGSPAGKEPDYAEWTKTTLKRGPRKGTAVWRKGRRYHYGPTPPKERKKRGVDDAEATPLSVQQMVEAITALRGDPSKATSEALENLGHQLLGRKVKELHQIRAQLGHASFKGVGKSPTKAKLKDWLLARAREMAAEAHEASAPAAPAGAAPTAATSGGEAPAGAPGAAGAAPAPPAPKAPKAPKKKRTPAPKKEAEEEAEKEPPLPPEPMPPRLSRAEQMHIMMERVSKGFAATHPDDASVEPLEKKLTPGEALRKEPGEEEPPAKMRGEAGYEALVQRVATDALARTLVTAQGENRSLDMANLLEQAVQHMEVTTVEHLHEMHEEIVPGKRINIGASTLGEVAVGEEETEMVEGALERNEKGEYVYTTATREKIAREHLIPALAKLVERGSVSREKDAKGKDIFTLTGKALPGHHATTAEAPAPKKRFEQTGPLAEARLKAVRALSEEAKKNLEARVGKQKEEGPGGKLPLISSEQIRAFIAKDSPTADLRRELAGNEGGLSPAAVLAMFGDDDDAEDNMHDHLAMLRDELLTEDEPFQLAIRDGKYTIEPRPKRETAEEEEPAEAPARREPRQAPWSGLANKTREEKLRRQREALQEERDQRTAAGAPTGETPAEGEVPAGEAPSEGEAPAPPAPRAKRVRKPKPPPDPEKILVALGDEPMTPKRLREAALASGMKGVTLQNVRDALEGAAEGVATLDAATGTWRRKTAAVPTPEEKPPPEVPEAATPEEKKERRKFAPDTVSDSLIEHPQSMSELTEAYGVDEEDVLNVFDRIRKEEDSPLAIQARKENDEIVYARGIVAAPSAFANKQASLDEVVSVKPASQVVRSKKGLVDPDHPFAQARASFTDLLGADISDDALYALGMTDNGGCFFFFGDAEEGVLTFGSHGTGTKASRTIIRHDDGTIECHNEDFAIGESSPLRGKGYVMFANQVAALRQAGVSFISTQAGGEPGTNINGYYTWPRLGYDAELLDSQLRDLPEDIQKAMGASRSILDLMEIPGGKEAWKEHGSPLLEAKFDLAPGSRSLKVLEAYIRERERKATTPGTVSGTTGATAAGTTQGAAAAGEGGEGVPESAREVGAARGDQPTRLAPEPEKAKETAPQEPAAFARSVLEEFAELRDERYPNAGMVPIGEVREAIRARYGDLAAGKRLDEALRAGQKERQIRLVPSDKDVPGGIKGVGETLAYIDMGDRGKRPQRKAKPYPSDLPPQPEFDTAVSDLAGQLRAAGGGEEIPIHELRQKIAEQYGADAARHDVFDEALRRLAAAGEIKLWPITDLSKASIDQLNTSVPGLGETLFYVESLKGKEVPEEKPAEETPEEKAYAAPPPISADMLRSILQKKLKGGWTADAIYRDLPKNEEGRQPYGETELQDLLVRLEFVDGVIASSENRNGEMVYKLTKKGAAAPAPEPEKEAPPEPAAPEPEKTAAGSLTPESVEALYKAPTGPNSIAAAEKGLEGLEELTKPELAAIATRLGLNIKGMNGKKIAREVRMMVLDQHRIAARTRLMHRDLERDEEKEGSGPRADPVASAPGGAAETVAQPPPKVKTFSATERGRSMYEFTKEMLDYRATTRTQMEEAGAAVESLGPRIKRAKGAEKEALQKEMTEAQRTRDDRKKELRRVRQEEREIFKERFAVEGGAIDDYTPESDMPTSMKDIFSEVLGFLTPIMAHDLGSVTLRQSPLVENEFGEKVPARARYDVSTVYAPRDANGETYAHELGHHLEMVVPGALKKAYDFRVSRVGREKPTRLKEKYPDCGYADNEVGFEDGFAALFTEEGELTGQQRAYYVGKLYVSMSGQVTNTEIVSIGLEMLFRDPVGFMSRDPEYAELILDILQTAQEQEGEST